MTITRLKLENWKKVRSHCRISSTDADPAVALVTEIKKFGMNDLGDHLERFRKARVDGGGRSMPDCQMVKCQSGILHPHLHQRAV